MDLTIRYLRIATSTQLDYSSSNRMQIQVSEHDDGDDASCFDGMQLKH